MLADRFRRYVFPFPKRKDIRFEAILETILPTEKRSQWETLDCDMAGIVLAGGPLKLEIRGAGSWTVPHGDAFYVREGQEHHAINASRRPVRLVTVYYPPRYAKAPYDTASAYSTSPVRSMLSVKKRCRNA